MGGLAHYFEDEGLATTQISLVRPHTETIRPPRALWVPFELGRPLGAPNDPDFQTKVVRTALDLLASPNGPVLEDFPEEAPFSEAPAAPVACPVSFDLVKEEETEIERLLSAFRQEVAQMRNWYDVAVENRGRSTADTTGLPPEGVAEFIAAFLRGEEPESPMAAVSLGGALRMAAEDLKAYYLEAVSAQPGQPTDSETLNDWFWGQTRAARVINEVRKICLARGEGEWELLGKLLLVPRTQLHRFQEQ